jgi:hypothetical protein
MPMTQVMTHTTSRTGGPVLRRLLLQQGESRTTGSGSGRARTSTHSHGGQW